MSSLINAAPYEESNLDNYLAQDRPSSSSKKNKTIKNRRQASQVQKVSTENLESIFGGMHQSVDKQDDLLGNFEPPPPPMSMGVETTKLRDDLHNQTEDGVYVTDSNKIKIPDFSPENETNYDKYRKYIPDYKSIYGTGVEMDQITPMNHMNALPPTSEHVPKHFDARTAAVVKDPLVNKLNHVIHLLEEQKDDKTSRVNEEIILYLFLGVFVIFIVDSFTRLGKYTR